MLGFGDSQNLGSKNSWVWSYRRDASRSTFWCLQKTQLSQIKGIFVSHFCYRKHWDSEHWINGTSFHLLGRINAKLHGRPKNRNRDKEEKPYFYFKRKLGNGKKSVHKAVHLAPKSRNKMGKKSVRYLLYVAKNLRHYLSKDIMLPFLCCSLKWGETKRSNGQIWKYKMILKTLEEQHYKFTFFSWNMPQFMQSESVVSWGLMI